MERFPQRVRHLCRESLLRKGIRTIEGNPLRALEKNAAVLGDGQSIPFSIAFLARGVRPAPIFRDTGLSTSEDGSLLVNEHLQSVSHPEVFGGGDCIRFEPRPLARVGVYAVRQNPVLLDNLQRQLAGEPLSTFTPQDRYLLAFNMGDGTAVVAWRFIVFGGRLGFRLKDHLDRSFMRRFQG